MAKKFWDGFTVAFLGYIGFFGVWLGLGFVCMGNGNSAAACSDNAMSRVVQNIYPVEAIANALR